MHITEATGGPLTGRPPSTRVLLTERQVGGFAPLLWALDVQVQVRDLTPTQKFVLIGLAKHADADGACYPSMERLAEFTGYTDRACRTAVRELERKGFVAVQVGTGRGNPSRYRLLMGQVVGAEAEAEVPPKGGSGFPFSHAKAEAGSSILRHEGGTASPLSHAKAEPRSRKGGTTFRRTTQGTTQEREGISPPPPKTVAAAGKPSGFDAFWARLPEQAKVGMEATRRAYEAEIKRGATHEQLLEAASRYPLNPDPRFNKHPANWLRQGHWKDKPPTATPPANGGNLSSLPFDKPSKTAWARKYLPTVPTGLTIDGEVELVR